MKQLKKIRLDEKKIIARMKESELKHLKGGLSSCLACGTPPDYQSACYRCYA